MKKRMPECFGDFETVFPKGRDGLRYSPEACLACLHKTPCLRSALKSEDGLVVKREMVDRAYVSGKMNFLQRWSQKKALFNRKAKGSQHRQKRSGYEKH